MTPEEKARQEIDRLLEAVGWTVQDYKRLNLRASLGVAVREFPLDTGQADYLLFVGGKAAGVVEAKPEGTTLGGVAEQSKKYLTGVPERLPHVQLPLPFAYESSGSETYFRDIRDPFARSRRVFAFHKPETLQEWASEDATLRSQLRVLPALLTGGLRDCQIDAVQGLEHSLREGRPRALIQMATGSGKTFAAVTISYRLIKHARARRILFLVDRANLGKQTEKEFQQFVTPDDGRKFTELYNVQRLTSPTIDPVSRVCISTIQRVYSMLKGRELSEEDEAGSLYEQPLADGEQVDVVYNAAIPIETFDFIIVDECHRSIYNRWRQVLEYFDAFLIGLTATPSKQTFGFFHQNLVMEYPHERAVADGVNVGFDVYRIRTQITEEGSSVEAGYHLPRRDKLTRRQRIEALDEDLEYDAAQLDRTVISPSQIRTVIRAFKDRLFTDLFPGRTEVPKTLIFAKDDHHAEEILHIVREEFGRGNEFAKKITYKVTGQKPEDLIAEFRTAPLPRIAVSVDMIATGTDIKPLECLLFMRDVKSSVYFEQMKGRGTRTIEPTDLQAVTPDAKRKTHFMLVDAVGVTENDKTDAKPLERKRSVSFKQILRDVALGIQDDDTLSSLAGRLARFDRTLTPEDRQHIREAAGGLPLQNLINGLLDAIDPDTQRTAACEAFGTDKPSAEQLAEAAEMLVDAACAPFSNPDLRETILEIKRRNEVYIDDVSLDHVIEAGPVSVSQAEKDVQSFKDFIETHRDEITALHLFYSQPYGKRHLTLQQVKELAQAIEQPPLHLTPERLWDAYARLERDKVKGVNERRLLTDIITLVRHAIGEDEDLVPFRDVVERRFYAWMNQQERAGRRFDDKQVEWLELIKERLAANLTVEMEDFQYPPFHEKGGRFQAVQLFGKDALRSMLNELNEAIAA